MEVSIHLTKLLQVEAVEDSLAKVALELSSHDCNIVASDIETSLHNAMSLSSDPDRASLDAIGIITRWMLFFF